MSNWIEKLVEDIWICHTLGHAPKRETFRSIVMSLAPLEPIKDAPVIDAEKLAKAVWEWFCYSDVTPKNHIEGITKVITSNLDLSTTWVDGKSKWGIFTLFCWQDGYGKWCWDITTGAGGYCLAEEEDVKTQDLAQAACVDALKRIVTGVKG